MNDMKVILVNGSPHKEGSTYHSLLEVARALNEENIETEIFWIGNKPIGGCIGCGSCFKTGKCALDDDGLVENFKALSKTADGFIFGSPVHYAAPAGNLCAFMDRAFYSARGIFRHKPAAAVVCARRGGCSAAFDRLNKYFTISEMPVISSFYWNMAHGAYGDQVLEDKEGMQTMYMLGKNMAYILKCQEIAREHGILPPERLEGRAWTNFIK